MLRIAWHEEESREGFQASKNEARSAFGDDCIFIEKFITEPRHIEIQVLGDRHGNIVHLNERECSIQRRNQKVIEEAPSPFLDEQTRAAMGAQAVALARAVGYYSAGTVEFIVDTERNFYFLEMNTRLQVEHPVTEMITGLDLVEWMIRIADGEVLPLRQNDIPINGWSVECRFYAEDPYRNFLPSTGRLTRYRPPQMTTDLCEAKLRNDTGVYEGSEIPVFYDPMISKLVSWGKDRTTAITTMRDALDSFEIEGIGSNLPFLAAVIQQERFRAGRLTTAYIAEEFPDGFRHTKPTEQEARILAGIAAIINHTIQQRATMISGTLDNHRRIIGKEWVVTFDNLHFPVTLHEHEGGMELGFANGESVSVKSTWLPGKTLGSFTIGATKPRVVKVDITAKGICLRSGATDISAQVREPHIARLAELMPVKPPADMSRMLLCPMPGIITSILAIEGDTVEAGQPLVTIEAMKMENMLRAEKKCVVTHIGAKVGQTLAVDQIIMEFK